MLCCCEQEKLHRSVRGLTGPTPLIMPQWMDLMREMQNVHRPLIMEWMLWLMMRSEVLHSVSDDDFVTPSGAEDCCAVEVIFGFALVHFGGSQG